MKSFLALVILSSVLIGFTFWFTPVGQVPNSKLIAQAGQSSLIIYWSAYQQFTTEGNPYDSDRLGSRPYFQNAESGTFWNWPTSLLILAPILEGSFISARYKMLLLNFVAIFATGLLILYWQSKKLSLGRLLLVLGSCSFFLPAWHCLGAGQMSILLGLALCGTLYCFEQRKDLIAATLLQVLIIKPHLVILPVTILFLQALDQRRYKFIILSAASFLVSLVLTLTISPSIIYNWWYMSLSPASMKTNTVVSLIRQILSESNIWPIWPIYAVPLLCLSTSLLLMRPLVSQKSPGSWLALAVSISIFASPYAWNYDYGLLLIPLLMNVIAISDLKESILKFALACLTLLLLVLIGISYSHSNHFKLIWLPVALALMTINIYNSTKAQKCSAQDL